MIDRSQFLDEIRNNPAILNRIAAIVHGEVGNASPEKLMIQAESIFNRAIARGQTLAEVTRTIPEGRGYYPQQTLDRGNAYMSNSRNFDQFRDKILRPVIGGSDEGTRKLGFAPTGNASDSGKNKYGEPYATGRAARNEYARTRWYQGGEKTGGKMDEMYVQEKGPKDKNERIDALRKGGPEPQPDPNAPQPAAAQPAPRSTGNLLADHVAGTPWEPTPEQQSALVTGVPSESPPPPVTATTTPATQTQSAKPAAAPRAAAAPAYQPKGFPGSRDDMPYDYIDPNTGHRIVNPKGSGETGMGLTRDIGPPPKAAAAPARAAAPAAAAAKPAAKSEEYSPRTVVTEPESVRTTPPEQVSRPDERSYVAPFDQSAMDPTPLPQQRFIDMGPYRDEGPTPLSAISGAADVAAMAPPQAGFLQTLFNNLSRTPDRPLSTPPATVEPTEPFAPGARSSPFPFAPAQRGPLDAPPPSDASLLPRGLQDPSAARNFGGTGPLNMAPPRTVDQQLGGLSPFAPSPPPMQLAGAFKPVVDYLNPMDKNYLDYPKIDPKIPVDPRAQPTPIDTPPSAPAGRPGPSMIGGLAPRGMDPLSGGQMPQASGSATQPTPQMAAMASMQADPTRDMQQTVDASGVNLSPFQDWPPPWWDGGYNFSGGSGNFDFGGGGGGGGWGGEGFANYGDFSLGNYG